MADAGRPVRRRAASGDAAAPVSPALPPRAPCCCLPSPLAGAIRTTVALSPPGAGEAGAPPVPVDDEDAGGAVA